MPHIVAGVLKDYDWGIVDGLAPWHGPTGGPQAELWFGVHPAGPTPVVAGPDVGRVLADFDAHRGMPLVKLLAAGAPLSVQVHPDARAAQAGWAARSPLYADGEEKSEMLVALEPFEIHAGWRDSHAVAHALAEAGAPEGVVDRLRAGDPVGAIRLILAAESLVDSHGLADAARAADWPAGEVAALARISKAFPEDPGVIVTALLAHDVLEPGQAIAVPAGIVHSYVGGLGVEVMTSSDNVLRLGLTSKPVAVDEALQAVRMDRQPERLSAGIGDLLAPSGMPFDLTLANEPRMIPQGRHRLVLAWQGDVRILDGPGSGTLVPQGRAAVWGPDEDDAQVDPGGLAIVVTGSA